MTGVRRRGRRPRGAGGARGCCFARTAVREGRTVLAEGLGLPKLSGRGTFLAVLLVDSLGTGLFAPFSLLYFHDGVGLPLATVGLTLSAAAAFALPVAPLAGAL